MANRNLFPLLLAFLVPCSVHGQGTQSSSGKSWQADFEQLSDYDDIESDNLEDLYERLCELEASPVDLNSATDDDLRQLSFLSASQLEDLTAYVDRYRPLRSMGELSMLQSIDPLRLRLLRQFTRIGAESSVSAFPALKDIAQYGKHELVATAHLPLYTRAGDRNGYLGYRYKHWLRYTFRYGEYVRFGFTGTQDAGEPFFAHGNNLGYDHYAYYLIVRRLGWLKTLALGQYKLRFGLGLVMNTGFTLGKTTSLVMSAPANTITPNSSRSDAYYLQGASATFALGKHFDITTFLSYRKIDATLNDDGTVKTILQTGYHRTESEMQRKHNTSQVTAGGNLRWRGGGWHAGASAVYTSFNRALCPDVSQVFRKYNPAGNNFFNGSVDYGYINHWLNVNGETAVNGDGAVATLNTVSLKTSPSLTLTAIQRYYSYRYNSLFGSSFSDGGKVQNESGVYLGVAWTPLARLSLLAYTDYAYFPWARYGVSSASHSWDNLVQATYNVSSATTLTVRYRLRLKQQDNTVSDSPAGLINRTEHRVRLAIASSGVHWQTKTQVDGAYVVFPAIAENQKNSLGGMLTQTVGYTCRSLSAAANVGVFYTRDYNSRLYAYERSTLYTFSFPMFYGKGGRVALSVRGDIGGSIVVIGKIGATKYFDRDVISSSLQQINSSWQTDVDLQVKWRF